MGSCRGSRRLRRSPARPISPSPGSSHPRASGRDRRQGRRSTYRPDRISWCLGSRGAARSPNRKAKRAQRWSPISRRLSVFCSCGLDSNGERLDLVRANDWGGTVGVGFLFVKPRGCRDRGAGDGKAESASLSRSALHQQRQERQGYPHSFKIRLGAGACGNNPSARRAYVRAVAQCPRR